MDHGAQVGPEEINAAIADLRSHRRRLLAQLGGEALQKRAVGALASLADLWRDPQYPIRRQAEQENAGFPFAMTWVSLDALLASWSQDSLRALIHEENVGGAVGPDLIGHVIASNTPLIAWTSIARALLVGSASLVKLPSHAVGAWAGYFREGLDVINPDLARLITLLNWKGGDPAADRALCEGCDLVLAYGSDQAIGSLEAHMPSGRRFIGYGHRVSFGIVESGADWNMAAMGFARDILLYDQGGCLSPHCIFVEGDREMADLFAEVLAGALANACDLPESAIPALEEDTGRAAAVREERMLARMEQGVRLWEDPNQRWTVVSAVETRFRPSITHGVVSVLPFAGKSLIDELCHMTPYLQGAAVASKDADSNRRWCETLGEAGVSYVCPAGELQRPPFAWRQNGLLILRSLVS